MEVVVTSGEEVCELRALWSLLLHSQPLVWSIVFCLRLRTAAPMLCQFQNVHRDNRPTKEKDSEVMGQDKVLKQSQCSVLRG